ncbi:hypothetical protein F511_43061 [Dorcoceras hygrometricum]|uniref:Uncharacterized protein n=1 Tax=Dorcoceras hygrometricum TaxID=472368 RepID=A0A2Z7AEY9_9LAMI|nr:hypothetical protein F511_43061 [Dorcoceras hygrometricum]
MFLVDWAVKMRIRPPEFETSICDAKYHVSLIENENRKASRLAADRRNHPPRPRACFACRAPRTRLSHASLSAASHEKDRPLPTLCAHWLRDIGRNVRAALRRPPCMNTGRSRTSAAAAPRACRAMMHGDGRRHALLAAQEMRDGRLMNAAAGRASCDGCAQNLRTALHRAMATAAIFVGGGRRPAAAPASLRRCRDGWSEFF